MAGLTDYAENKIIDWLLRAQAIGLTGATAAAGTGPATLYVGLFTAAPTDAGGGTECTGNAYARAPITSALANWAGTQSAGSTTASSGTGGVTSNNGVITFATPTPSGWGTVVAFGLFDHVSNAVATSMIAWNTMTSKVINAGDTVTFPIAALTFTLD